MTLKIDYDDKHNDQPLLVNVATLHAYKQVNNIEIDNTNIIMSKIVQYELERKQRRITIQQQIDALTSQLSELNAQACNM